MLSHSKPQLLQVPPLSRQRSKENQITVLSIFRPKRACLSSSHIILPRRIFCPPINYIYWTFRSWEDPNRGRSYLLSLTLLPIFFDHPENVSRCPPSVEVLNQKVPPTWLWGRSSWRPSYSWEKLCTFSRAFLGSGQFDCLLWPPLLGLRSP